MKNDKYDVNKARLRCSNWLQNQHYNPDACDKFMSEDTAYDLYSDPHQDALTYSADEEISNQSQLGKRAKRNATHDEDLSELSEISQYQLGNKRRQIICEDGEMDTSVASDEASVKTARKTVCLKNETFQLSCGWKNCNYFSTNVEGFVKHVSTHISELDVKCSEEEDEEVYICHWESCNFETPNPDEVTRHVNFHSYHTKVKYIGALVCSSLNLPECSYSKAGVNLVPDLPRPLQCLWDNCILETNNPNIYYGHVALHARETSTAVPKKDEKFKCLWKGCKTEVSNRRRMVEHLRGHSKERVAACPTCGMLYSTRIKLIDHIKRQASEESMTYQCTHCSRSYPSERLLREHMRHHVNHYKCQFCDMTCATPHSLSNHIRHRHLDEKPFACEYCNYKAKTQYNLRRHMTTHSTSANFDCDEEDCDFSCRTMNIMNWHYRKKHEARAVYCCHMCDMRFARGAYLTKHLMKKHKFRWPSGHTRFRFYRNHEDGLFRLQTVRYESLDVVEDISRREAEPVSILNTSSNFNILKTSSSNECIAANFIVSEEGPSDDDPDDPMPICDDTNVVPKAALSMPSLDVDSPPTTRKVLISIEEVDATGNIITSQTMEVEELSDLDEDAHIIADGTCVF